MSDQTLPAVDRDECGDQIVYRGTREAFIAAGLAPDEPFEIPGKRGVRFVNQAGRRVVIAKNGPGHYRLTEHFTKEEKARRKHAEAVRRRTADVESRISGLSQTEESFRRSAANMLDAYFAAFLNVLFTQSVGEAKTEEQPWSFDSAAKEKLRESYWTLKRTFESGRLIRNTSALEAARREKAALSDDGFQQLMRGIVA